MMHSNPLLSVGKAAQKAAGLLCRLSGVERSSALMAAAAELRNRSSDIIAANALDVEEARIAGRPAAFLDRLQLTSSRLEQTVSGMEQVVKLSDPIGDCLEEWTRPNGLRIRKVRVPLGVIGFVYESRPSVTCDAAALCVKSGNAVILRGGKESIRTNELMTGVIRSAFHSHGVPEDAVQLLSTGDREEVKWLCGLEGFVDVLIPRGGKGLVSAVVESAKMPVLKHLDGVCHTFVDAGAEMSMALSICDDAKTQRPGVCNTMETLLVHRDIASAFLPLAGVRLRERGVELRACPESASLLGVETIPATEEDWSTEYEDLILSVRLVADVNEAIEHVNRYGSHHSDSIVTADAPRAQQFLDRVDSACVYWNCSTRFSDGEEFGFGAEVGIATDRIHARGPMGIRELTSYKYEIFGNGQVKDPYR